MSHGEKDIRGSREDNRPEIRAAIERICKRFDHSYWLHIDNKSVFPHEFYNAVAEGGWLGIAMPEEYGGAGLGIVEAAVMMRAVAQSGAAMSGASAIHMNIFGLQPVVLFGTEEQKRRFLPPLIRGQEKACFAVTEPDAGLNTLEIRTTAVRDGSRYLVCGQKTWISTAQVADRMLLLARTTPVGQSANRTEGLSLFYTKIDRRFVKIDVIQKMGRHGVDSNTMYIEDLEVSAEDLIGVEGSGFKQILHGLNAERILIASEAVGLGFCALEQARCYARERHVFGRPIGKNQSIQHPLAESWMSLEAAAMMVEHAALAYDLGTDCGPYANAAKYLAAEAAFKACDNAVLTMGGMGYASEFQVERLLRESYIPRLAPVSMQMIKNYIAERVLELDRSY